MNGLVRTSAAFLAALLFCAPRSGAQSVPLSGTSFDVDIYGNLYVLDGGKNTLTMYDRGGTLRKSVGGPGWLDGQFDRPSCVWARNGIDVFVADYGNHRIERFDRSLSFISSFSTRESDNPDDRFGYPAGVALSRLGELFICDTENGRIVKVDRFSTVERTFGGIGGGKGRLAAPSSVAVGPNDGVYVLDEARIAIFDAFGNYLRDLAPGLLRRPSALYADNDVVAVADSESILVFDEHERPVGIVPFSAVVPEAGLEFRALAVPPGALYVLTTGGIFRAPDPRRPADLDNNPISH